MNNLSEIKTKTCNKCHLEKPLSKFPLRNKLKETYRCECRSCRITLTKTYRNNNRDLIQKRRKIHYEKNKEKIKQYSKSCYYINRESIAHKGKEYRQRKSEEISERRKKYYIKNKNILQQKSKEYQIKNRESIRKQRKKYYQLHYDRIKANRKDRRSKTNAAKRERLKNDINFRIRTILSSHFAKMVKNSKTIKCKRTLEILGCSLDYFKQYLESQFKEGMTWENHKLKGWHMDHIKPCASFDLTDPKQQEECFHYTNIQPLWWYENLAKRDKIGWKN